MIKLHADLMLVENLVEKSLVLVITADHMFQRMNACGSRLSYLVDDTSRADPESAKHRISKEFHGIWHETPDADRVSGSPCGGSSHRVEILLEFRHWKQSPRTRNIADIAVEEDVR